MDWLDDMPEVTGGDKVLAQMAQRLIDGPVVFRIQYWGGMGIEILDDYRAWVCERIEREPNMERRALKIWQTEINRSHRVRCSVC
jgi:hypothetical protein